MDVVRNPLCRTVIVVAGDFGQLAGGGPSRRRDARDA
jgi:hypothetical protein